MKRKEKIIGWEIEFCIKEVWEHTISIKHGWINSYYSKKSLALKKTREYFRRQNVEILSLRGALPIDLNSTRFRYISTQTVNLPKEA